MRSLIDRLVAARIGHTTNFYRDGPGAALRRDRLAAYLEQRADAAILLVGEAPGYRGARVSGVPFTSERQLTGTGPAEATATIVQRVLAELGATESVLLWNVVPTHPGTETTNRVPSREEIAAGSTFAFELARGRRAIGVGRIAAQTLGAPYVRHPSHGGARDFAESLAALIAR
jgi:uracil-DNA glycosylase